MPAPTRRASLCVPPNPGVMPSPTSGCPNTAFSEQILMSQLMEISHPPPSAKPFTAAITGIGKVSSLRNTSLPFLPKASPSALVRVLISPISAPATKDFWPAPVRIRQRTASRSTPSSVLSSSSSTVEFRAFSAFSRLMVMIPTCPFTSYNTNSIFSSFLRCFCLPYPVSHQPGNSLCMLFVLFNYCGAAHAAADAQCGKTCLCALCLHLVKQCHQDAASGCAHRMT